ncbi:helix-turn-helix transcriptional regulator [Thermomonospora cellulosilytica]|uniref:DNA-binding CsgD family transcriptional regulator n=1 Tax=Thermomonospora cellulosilytica TaxID=1411118 RepID=A0A7W3R834_9ACTN|nr:helix-turn-helix transcriptional regulator [Thermomonospora cellulosilytica]MBA9003149.1 DNA-binding CsgD family transcriptional regulator [Thermomonospora cellulosilytica]
MDLDCLGISAEVEQVYRHLLRHPDQDPAAVAAELAMPLEAVRAAVARLAELALLTVDGSGVHLTDPAVGLERLIGDRLEELHEEVRRTLAARAAIGSFHRDFRQGANARPVPDIERVDGLARVRQRIDDLAFYASRETLCLQPGGPMAAGAIEAARGPDMRSLRRGITLRSVFHARVLNDQEVCDYLHDLSAMGSQIRITEDRINRLLVYDRAVAVVPVDPARAWRGALLVREPGLVAQMVAHFYTTWDAARDLKEYLAAREGGGPQISEHDRAVLRALASHDKDEAAARQLNISVRTFRRHVADLMGRLGAANRFHAALLAKENGWI